MFGSQNSALKHSTGFLAVCYFETGKDSELVCMGTTRDLKKKKFKEWQCYTTTDWAAEIWVVRAGGKKVKYVEKGTFMYYVIS